MVGLILIQKKLYLNCAGTKISNRTNSFSWLMGQADCGISLPSK